MIKTKLNLLLYYNIKKSTNCNTLLGKLWNKGLYTEGIRKDLD